MKFLLMKYYCPKKKFFSAFSDYPSRALALVLLIFVLPCLLPASANAQSVNNTDLTLSIEKGSLEDFIKQIERETPFKFAYEKKQIEKFTDIKLPKKKRTIDETLRALLANTSLIYKQRGNYIVLTLYNKPVNPTLANLTNPKGSSTIIKGTVIDEKGVPAPGVSIVEIGSGLGTTTDINGGYKITVKKLPTVLVFSYVGYLKQNINVDTANVVNVTLKPSSSNLNEVVVVGFGTQSKALVSTSIASVDVKDLQKAPVLSFDQALAGRVAGVQVVSQDGQPGAPISIIIRGNNSLTQDNSPLYVIDGFPIENPDNNTINPSQIESIQVLKDAAATAIYGARAANGVILITTKKGKRGDAQVEFQAYYAQQKVIKTIPLLSPYEYVKYLYELNATNTLASYLQNAPNNPSSIDSAMTLYKQYPAADFQKEIFGRPAPFINYDISVRGGSDKTLYNIAGNYADQTGIVSNTGFKRYQLKLNLDQRLSDKVRIGINSTYNYTNKYGVQPVSSGTSGLAGGTSYLLASIWGYRPVSIGGDINSLLNSAYDASIDPNNVSQIYNPLFSAENEYHSNQSNNIFINGYLDYQIVRNLKLRLTAGVNSTDGKVENFYNSLTSRGRISPINANGVNGDFTITKNTNITSENTLTYDNKFGPHHFNVLAGVTGQQVNTNFDSENATLIQNESLGINGLGSGTPGIPVVNSSQNKLLSFLGRVQYDYDAKYLLTGSYRGDGSSKFAPNNRWSYFPSFSAAWRFTEEKFLKNNKIIGDGKLRFGYGATGNNRVSDFVTYSTLVNSYIPVNGSFVYINNVGALGNKDLKWETTQQTDLGLDLSFLKGRLALTVDAYNKVTSNLLLNAQLPPSSGFATGFKNIGKVSNTGLEISLSSNNIVTTHFNWSSNFNISFNKSKVLALTENQEVLYGFVSWNSSYNSSPLYIAKVGQPIGEMFGYVSDGVYQYSDFDKSPSGAYTLKANVPTNYTTRATSPVPGAVKLKDLNGDGVITPADRTVIGHGQPIHVGGFNNNFTYDNIDLNIFFQWSYGNDVYNANRLIFENGSPNNSLSYLNQYATYANRWSPNNQTNDMPSANPGAMPGNYYWSRVVEDGSFLRLKTVSLGYTFPKKLLRGVKAIKNIRIYASGQNVWTWTKYSGLDPEVNANTSALTPGFDYSVYPRARTLTFGLNATF